ncbi:MAG: hypothetical protein QM820_13545 [Minicystis sp.]
MDHGAERVLIGARRHPRSPPLLRRHVRRRAQRHARGRELHRLALDGLLDLGDPEVEHAHARRPRAALGGPLEEDVVGLEIAVDDARRVHGVERVRDGARDAPGLGRREAFARVDLVAHRSPFEQRHDEVRPPVVEPPEGEDVDDRRVPDLVHGPGLALEAGRHGRILGVGAAQHLDGDALPDRRLLGRVHGADAALPELPFDAISADHAAGGQPALDGIAHRARTLADLARCCVHEAVTFAVVSKFPGVRNAGADLVADDGTREGSSGPRCVR